MQIKKELAQFVPEKETILAIGVFDGVHLGHKHLISYAQRQALVRNLLAGVVTFRCHPQEVLSPQNKVPYLSTLEEKIRLVQSLGVDFVIPLSFTRELAELSARQFLALLQQYLKMQGLVVGSDFTLGRGREGNTFVLHQLGKEMGFTVEVVPPLISEGEVVSSTAIRQALAEGDMERVEKLLGRPFSLSGDIVPGAGRGVGLGFPTANLAVNSDQASPANGIYATRAYLGDRALSSVTNIGFCPTFGGRERTVEVFLLDFQGSIYGQKLKIQLVKRLREERCFSSVAELTSQIEEDVRQARDILPRGAEVK